MEQQRLKYNEIAPEPYNILIGLEKYLHKCGLEHPLLHMVKLRASQINGCAYCIDMHSKDLRAGGETEQRVYSLSAWRECPYYTDRERAALEWTEAVTLLAETHVPEDVYQRVREVFSEKELVDLNYAVVTINAWNRLAATFRTTPGTYQPVGAKR